MFLLTLCVWFFVPINQEVWNWVTDLTAMILMQCLSIITDCRTLSEHCLKATGERQKIGCTQSGPLPRRFTMCELHRLWLNRRNHGSPTFISYQYPTPRTRPVPGFFVS